MLIQFAFTCYRFKDSGAGQGHSLKIHMYRATVRSEIQEYSIFEDALLVWGILSYFIRLDHFISYFYQNSNLKDAPAILRDC